MSFTVRERDVYEGPNLPWSTPWYSPEGLRVIPIQSAYFCRG